MAQCLIAGSKQSKKQDGFTISIHISKTQDFEQNIIFEVDRIRDGKSFTTRRVNAIQNGEAIFSCSISFQKREKGLSHQIKMPKILQVQKT